MPKTFHTIITEKAEQTPDFFFIQIGGKDGKTYAEATRFNKNGGIHFAVRVLYPHDGGFLMFFRKYRSP